jgi:FkbM family methyltransferase
MLKFLLKNFFWKNNIVIHKRQPWMENYKWLIDYDVNTIIDIGANIGQFSKWAYEIFDKPDIHAFEPITKVYDQLKVNLESFEKIKVYNFGIGNIEEVIFINVNENSPSSSILELDDKHIENFDFAINTYKEKIILKKLDTIIDITNLKQNILIKIDVQGYEYDVILGSIKVMEHVKVILIELSFVSMYKKQHLFNDVLCLLNSLGFQYIGNLTDQSYDKITGAPMFADAVFIK